MTAPQPCSELHDAAYYLHRIKDLPSAYKKQIQELKAEVLSRRLLQLSLGDLCLKLSLDAAAFAPEVFLGKSPQIFLGTNQLLEKFGLKLAPFMIPAYMPSNQQLILTLKPNLHNDEDISFVQALLKSGRELHNRDMVFVHRMQLKLANYNILLRVIEGIASFSRPQLCTRQLEYLNNLINTSALPVEGAAYLKACYTFLSTNPCYKVDFNKKEYCLPSLEKAEHQQLISLHLAQLAAREPVKMEFTDTYPLSTEIKKAYLRLSPKFASAYIPSSREHAAWNNVEAARHSILIGLSQRLEDMRFDARHQASLLIKTHAVASKVIDIAAVLHENLLRDSTLSDEEMGEFICQLKDRPRLLNLMPPVDKLYYLPEHAGIFPNLPQGLLGIVTQDPELKQLYPYFIFLLDKSGVPEGSDPLCCDFFCLPAVSQSKLHFNAHQHSTLCDFANLICLHQLVIRNMIAGFQTDSIKLFEQICTTSAHKYNRYDDLSSIITLFYYLYAQHLPRQMCQSLPEIVIHGLISKPLLLTLFSQRLLRSSKGSLQSLSPAERSVCALYLIMTLHSANAHWHISSQDLNAPENRTVALNCVVSFCLEYEASQAEPLFLPKNIALQENIPIYPPLSVNKLFTLALYNDFLNLLPDALYNCVTKELTCIYALKRKDILNGLLQSFSEHSAIMSYLNFTLHEMPGLQALLKKSQLPHQRRKLQELLGNGALVSINAIENNFYLPGGTAGKLVLNHICSCAHLRSVPDDPLLYKSISGTGLTVKFITDFTADFNIQERLNFNAQLLYGQIALHFYLITAGTTQHAVENLLLELQSFKCEKERNAALLYYRAFSEFINQNKVLSLSLIKKYYARFKNQEIYSLALNLLQQLARRSCGNTIADLCLIRNFEKTFKAIGLPRSALIALSLPLGQNHRLQHFKGFDSLDQNLISSKLQESSEVLDVIGQIRAENENQNKDVTDAKSGAPATTLSTGTEEIKTETLTPSATPDIKTDSGAQLDPGALELLRSISSQQSEIMDLNEFSGLCLSARFMSSSVAVEMLNDFSYEHFDEPLFDLAPEENAVYISTELLARLLGE